MTAAPDKPRILRLAMAQQAALFIINFGQSIVIARLLAPAEIGTFSVAMAAIVIASALKSAGIGNYLLQEKELDDAKIRSVLGLAIAVAVGLAALVVLAAAPIAHFYGNPQIREILWVAAVGMTLAPFQATAIGLLSRQLKFDLILKSSVAGSVTAAATAIGLVLAGVGPVSLAWAEIANAIVATVVMVAGGVPGFTFRPSTAGWRTVWRVSGWTMGGSLLNQVGGRSSELVLGKTLGLQAAAFFDRADTLPRMIWNYLWPALYTVLTSVLAHDIRRGHDPRALVLPQMRYLSTLFVPGMMILGTQSESILLAIYGPQWAPSVPVAFWICLSSIWVLPFAVINSVLVGMGRTRPIFLLNVMEQSARLAILLLFATTDIVTVAMALNLVSLTYAVAAVSLMRHYGALRLSDLIPTLWPSAATALVVMLAGFGLNDWLADLLGTRYLLRALLSGAALGLVWLGAVWVLDRRMIHLLLRLIPTGAARSGPRG